MKRRGAARSNGPDYVSVVAGDRIEPPAPLLETAYSWIDADEVDAARYVSEEFQRLENERLWPRTWQMACREEHIPEPGDFYVYDVADLSIVVLRTPSGEVRAFHNSCLHRGTTLVEGAGHANVLRCPFHGFSWNLDGTFRGMPADWDFPQVQREDFSLPEARVALWGGFVLVNPDGKATPFEDYAEPLTAHFAPYPLDERYVAYHTCQVVEANWKTTQEAFLEGYHVSTTHGHTVRFANDFDCAYDVFGANVSRLVQALAVPATQLVGHVSQSEMAATIQKMMPSEDRREVPDDVQARPWLADGFRRSFSRQWRCDLSSASDAEMLDSIQYFLFPNFAPWGGYAIPIAYRFRPWQNDPNRSLMEIMMLHPKPDDGVYEVAEPFWLAAGQSWTEAPGFKGLGFVIDQDMANLPRVQKGLRAAQHDTLTLSDYQETRIRHFHARLNEVLGL